MDGDPAVEPELDTFSLILPLPYRVSLIIVLGAWAWGLNLHYLHLLKIDVPALIRYPPRRSPTQPSHHLTTYRLATILTIPLLVSLLLFWALTRLKSSLVIAYSPIPNLYLLLLPLAFFVPLRGLPSSGRTRFLQTLRRVSIGGIAEAGDGKFGDILLADVLTSYAKVGGDLFVALCMMVSRASASSTSKPDRSCGGAFIVPFLISVPSLIRLRQCLIEYMRVRRSLEKGEADVRTSGWGGQHLGNALKYSSAFPVVILSALQRGPDSGNVGIGETGLFRLWLLFVFINSFYSFYWDVAKDWDLSLFESLAASAQQWLHKTTSRSAILLPNSPAVAAGNGLPSEYPYGLRRNRYIHAPGVYYTVIGLDLLLRCTWSFKLSPHLNHFNDLEGGIFMMELLEVFRRWVWIFLRVETEWGESRLFAFAVGLTLWLTRGILGTVRNNRGPAIDDVLLGEVHNGKLDED
ncbi:MAG: protein-ER retention protein [Chrysothrix sp. TS-e1954]|nr:MAG: protein-ER retention protein [Chrysothrix sp. TS-e1954]